MPVIESIALVISETVVMHHITHPFEVGYEHLLHIYIVMTPVTRAVPVLAIVHVARRSAVAVSCIRIEIHLIVRTDIRLIRIEHTILAEIHLIEIAPRTPVRTMVDHDIRHHFGTRVVKRADQRFQFCASSPIGVLVTILLRMITRAIAVCTRRKPYIIEIPAQLGCLRRQSGPFSVAILAHTRRTRTIRLVVKSLHHHRLALTRNGSGVDIMYIFSLAAIRTVADIQLILLPFQLDIEIIAAVHVGHVMIAAATKAGYRITIQIHSPSRLILSIIELKLIPIRNLHMRQILLKTFELTSRFSGKIRRAVYQNTVTAGITPSRSQYGYQY